ncbi:MAG: sensor domain-containing diguanylate cyclase [Noviherbaspirillum sp.]
MITLGICGSVLVTVLALVLMVDQFARNYAQRQATVRLQQVAWQMRDSLNRGMRDAVGDVSLLAELKELRDARSPDDMRRPMENMQRLSPNYAWIGLASPDGTIYAATQKLLEGKNVSARPWFQNARTGVTAVDYHAALMLEKMLQQGPDPWRFVDVSIPVLRSDGSVRGIMGAHLSWAWARELAVKLLAPAGERYALEILIVRNDGTVLLGPKSMEEKQLASASIRLARAGGSGVVDESSNGQRYLTGYALTGLEVGYPSLKWTVLVRQPYKVAMADFKLLQQRIVMVGAALALLLGVAGMLFARRMSRPLIRLSSALENYSPERPSEVPVISEFHEAHLLSSTLAGMVKREQRYRESLTAMNENLEQTVQARTREIEAKARELEQMAMKDMLTDLPNRRALLHRLPEALARSARVGKPLAVFFLDLDGFKGVNDRYGHDAGDELLKILAQRIVATVRRTDTVARLAGDEFVVVLELLSHAKDAAEVAAKLLPVLAQPFALQAAAVTLSGSIGIAMHAPGSDEAAQQLMARADHAMYQAKEGGRNRYCIAPPAG